MNEFDPELEAFIQGNISLVDTYLKDRATRYFHEPVNDINVYWTETKRKVGVTGEVFISKIYYHTEYGDYQATIAFKYYLDEGNILPEIKNALELDIRFKSSPEFGVARLLYTSTKDPIMAIYEGIPGINYDEIAFSNKAYYAGRILAELHTHKTKNVDLQTYKTLAQLIAMKFAVTGKEREISLGLGKTLRKIDGRLSGCNTHGDFHQSNVMLHISDNEVMKTYILDPEYMQKGNFDRMDDMGTFFGDQLLQEYLETGDIRNGINDVYLFLNGYNRRLLENGGKSLKEMYPQGNPLTFFVSQWALMKILDDANRYYSEDITNPTGTKYLNFVLYILNRDPFIIP